MNNYVFYTVVSEGDLPFISRFFSSLYELYKNLYKHKINYTYVIYCNDVHVSDVKNCIDFIDSKTVEGKIVIKSRGSKRRLKQYINETVKNYKGDFYCRFDPDDLIIPLNFTNFILYNNKHKGHDFCYADCYVVDENNNIVDQEEWDASEGEHYFLSQPPHGAYCLISSRVMNQKPFAEHIVRQDGFETWLRVLSRGYIKLHYNDFVFKYRRGHTSLSSNFSYIVNDRMSIIKEYLPFDRVVIVVTLLDGFDKQIWYSEFVQKIKKWLNCNLDGVDIIFSYSENLDINIQGVTLHRRTSSDLFTALKESVQNYKDDTPTVWLNPRNMSNIKLDHLLTASRVISKFKCPLIPTILCRQTVYQQVKGFGIKPINSSHPFLPRAFRKDCYISTDKFIAADAKSIKQHCNWKQVISGKIWSFELDYMGDLF